jgi:hypothetical protein
MFNTPTYHKFDCKDRVIGAVFTELKCEDKSHVECYSCNRCKGEVHVMVRNTVILEPCKHEYILVVGSIANRCRYCYEPEPSTLGKPIS